MKQLTPLDSNFFGPIYKIKERVTGSVTVIGYDLLNKNMRRSYGYRSIKRSVFK